jgi:regulator of cell morphogenesis and NO signaling
VPAKGLGLRQLLLGLAIVAVTAGGGGGPVSRPSGISSEARMIDAATTLGDVVTANPTLNAELARRGLDYCCGDDRTLATTRTDRGPDLRSMMAALCSAPAATSDEAPGWATRDAAEPVDHLEPTHHLHQWDERPRLSTLIATIVMVHGDRRHELPPVADRFAQPRTYLAPHVSDEEQVPFPAIRVLVTPGAAPPGRHGPVSERIAGLLAEHDRVGGLSAALSGLTDGCRQPGEEVL